MWRDHVGHATFLGSWSRPGGFLDIVVLGGSLGSYLLGVKKECANNGLQEEQFVVWPGQQHVGVRGQVYALGCDVGGTCLFVGHGY